MKLSLNKSILLHSVPVALLLLGVVGLGAYWQHLDLRYPYGDTASYISCSLQYYHSVNGPLQYLQEFFLDNICIRRTFHAAIFAPFFWLSGENLDLARLLVNSFFFLSSLYIVFLIFKMRLKTATATLLTLLLGTMPFFFKTQLYFHIENSLILFTLGWLYCLFKSKNLSDKHFTIGTILFGLLAFMVRPYISALVIVPIFIAYFLNIKEKSDLIRSLFQKRVVWAFLVCGTVLGFWIYLDYKNLWLWLNEGALSAHARRTAENMNMAQQLKIHFMNTIGVPAILLLSSGLYIFVKNKFWHKIQKTVLILVAVAVLPLVGAYLETSVSRHYYISAILLYLVLSFFVFENFDGLKRKVSNVVLLAFIIMHIFSIYKNWNPVREVSPHIKEVSHELLQLPDKKHKGNFCYFPLSSKNHIQVPKHPVNIELVQGKSQRLLETPRASGEGLPLNEFLNSIYKRCSYLFTGPIEGDVSDTFYYYHSRIGKKLKNQRYDQFENFKFMKSIEFFSHENKKSTFYIFSAKET